MEGEHLVIDVSTPVGNIHQIMASRRSKDSLTLFFADKLISSLSKTVQSRGEAKCAKKSEDVMHAGREGHFDDDDTRYR